MLLKLDVENAKQQIMDMKQDYNTPVSLHVYTCIL